MKLTVWEQRLAWAPASPAAYVDPHDSGSPEVTYEARAWTSPVADTDFPVRELITSWNASTPQGTWLHVEGRVETVVGWSAWFTFARWALDDPEAGAPIVRTTQPDQVLEAGRVVVDTFRAAADADVKRWQVRVTGLRETDASAWPALTMVAVAASAIEIGPDEPTSAPGVGVGLEIEVPPLSQRLHVDSFPAWDNGGQSWCSPTSITMLLRHWGVAPTPAETAWVGHGHDPEVVHSVRQVFDRAYEGAGNWAFNAAYAATRGLRAYITRLRDLTEAEVFIAAGVPLVVSVAFDEDELEGAGYGTRGHLLTIVGFTETGDVISNDPNSHRIPSNDEVRTIYRRDQFEKVWLGEDGGLAYVMHPREVALPRATRPAEPNWG